MTQTQLETILNLTTARLLEQLVLVEQLPEARCRLSRLFQVLPPGQVFGSHGRDLRAFVGRFPTVRARQTCT